MRTIHPACCFILPDSPLLPVPTQGNLGEKNMLQTRNSSVTSSLSPDTLFPQSSQTGVGNRHILLGSAKLVLCSRGTKLGTDSISGARGDLPVHEHEQMSCAGHEHGKSAQSCSEESSQGAQTWLTRGRSCMAHQIRKKKQAAPCYRIA